ncbi:MAG: PKD domain-containing protein [Bacteroidia bacterium]
MGRHLLNYIFIAFLLFSSVEMGAQCPQVYDGNGTPSSAPNWISCSGSSFTLNFSSPSALTGYSIDWGDGTAVSSGASLAANTFITHTYGATVDTFIVTLTTTTPACTVSGVVVMEKPVNASIQIPVGGVTTACAPAALQFTNSSTDVSATTTFTWDFGDGSPVLIYDESNAGQTVTHTYQKGTVNCQTIVTLTAENYCSFGNPTSAQFNPIQIYDIDDADATPDAFVKCWPDNSFTFNNTTSRNCVPQGNVAQRYEKWNFGNYWGAGHDSIIDWTPWPPTFPHTLAYPSVGNYDIMLIDSNTCGIDTALIFVSIVNPPTANLTAPVTSACAGSTLTFNNTSTAGYSYQWNFGDNPTYTTTGGGAQTHTYNVAGTYTVSVIAFVLGSNASCSDTAQLVVSIKANPVSAFTRTPAAGCDNLTVSFTDVSTNPVSWSWNFGNGNTSTLQAPPNQNYTVGNYTVTLTVTAANACTNSSAQTVKVFISPVAAFTTSPTCQNSITQFTDASTFSAGDPITTWSWNFGDASALSAVQNPMHTYTSSSAFTVTLNVSTANCSGSSAIPVTINPLPIAAFTRAPGSGCGPLTVSYTNTSTGALNYNWSFGNGSSSTTVSPVKVFTNTNSTDTVFTTQLIAITAAGCRDTITDTVHVFGKPIAGFTFATPPGCAPFPVTFTNTSQAASSYSWDFGDTQTSTVTSPVHTYQNTSLFVQNYSITLITTNTGGCTDTLIKPITVNPQPLFGFNIVPASGCTPLLVNFPSVAGAVLYQWNFGDGNSATGGNPVHTYTNTTSGDTTYTVQLIATNAFNCKDTTTGSVLVHPRPSAAFSISALSGCSPLVISFSNTSSNASSYSWNFGDGSAVSSAITPAHTFVNSSTTATATYSVQLIAENLSGCKDSLLKTLTVFPTIIAGFSTNDTLGCSPFNVSVTNSSVGASSYAWDFDDGFLSASTNPSHTYTNNTLIQNAYVLELIATNASGCKDTLQKDIAVSPKPLAGFTQNVNAGCQPLGVNFTNTTAGVNTYLWDFDDGSATSIVSSPAHNFINNSSTLKDTSFVSLIATNSFGCKDTLTSPTVAYPKIIAQFYADTPICAPVSVMFHNTSQGANSYNWNLGDGNFSNLDSLSHPYTNNGPGNLSYTVTLTATSAFGCTSVFNKAYTIYPMPQVAFTASPVSQLYPATTVTLNNTTPNASGFTSSWSFGDSTTSVFTTPAPHAYTYWGTHNITLVMSSQFCSDSVTHAVTIIPPVPVASFQGSFTGCRPLSVNLQNTSLYGTSYQWNFGDGIGSSSVKNPFYVYNTAGTFTITLTVTGPGGVNTVSGIDSAVVYPIPTAVFGVLDTNVTIPTDEIVCVNASSGAVSYLWNFGDGNTSADPNPTHTYSNAGDYQVFLIAYSSHNCVDTSDYKKMIHAEEASELIIPNAFSPNSASASSDGIYDPNSKDNDIFHPVIHGIKKYELSIYSRWGELLFESKDIKIGWDGYYHGKICTQDVYIWKIKATTNDGKQINKAGDVLLVRP